MLRKILSGMLIGISLLGMTGCGEAPIDVNSVINKYEEASEIYEKDLETMDLYLKAEQANTQCKLTYNFTAEEQQTEEFKRFGTLSKTDIEGMDNNQLKETNDLLDSILILGTNDQVEVNEVEYSAETRNNLINLYSELINIMKDANDMVNYLDKYKMNVNEYEEMDDGVFTIYDILTTRDNNLEEITETVNDYNEVFVFDDEIAEDINTLQKAHHNFVVQYPKEAYPRDKDSEQLIKARKEINRIWDKYSMVDIRMMEGVIAPTK